MREKRERGRERLRGETDKIQRCCCLVSNMFQKMARERGHTDRAKDKKIFKKKQRRTPSKKNTKFKCVIIVWFRTAKAEGDSDMTQRLSLIHI